jgi:molybdopterin molybdotransferase
VSVASDELLTISEALELVLGRAATLEAEEVPLDEAAGRVLAAPAAAAVDLPSFPASAMDGFALRAGDAPATLPVVARIAAGRPAAVTLEAGQAMAIATGGVVPDGADSVVPIEDVEERDGVVVVPGVVQEGANVRERGGDLVAGDLVVAAGTRLGPVHLGALAAAGVTRVSCARAPRVVLAVTGTELRSPGERLERGEIYDANGVILATQIRSTGAQVERLSPVADDAAATRAAITRGLEADVLVTSGGVSVGVYDIVRATEAELGVEEVFWRVAVRPGKPVAFGVRGRTLVFGLPGNPVSSLVGFELFVRPALLALQGLAAPGPLFRPGRLGRNVKLMAARDSLLRACSRVEDGAVVLDPLTGQESHMIARAATADVLVLIPRGEGSLPAGSLVSYLAL